MDDETPSSNDDDRTIELSSIAAIFPELILDPTNPYTATLEIPVAPVKPLRIHFRQAADDVPPLVQPLTPPTSTSTEGGPVGEKKTIKVQVSRINSQAQVDAHDLEHLPPLSLKVTLPSKYPTEDPPEVELHVSPPWLPIQTLHELKNECSKLWEELGRDQVVYSYIDHLQQQAENAFGLASNVEVPMSSDIKIALLDFDLKTKREKFEKETFDCGVCLEPKKGKDCHRLMLCGHVFCVACLKDFYNNCITEGDVDNVKCLSPNCGKEKNAELDGAEPPRKRRKQDRTINPSELLQIPIEQELVQRYVKLKRKRKLESDKNTIYCPRQWCQGAARSKKHPKPSGEMDDFTSESEEEQPMPEIDITKKKKKKADDIPMSERLAVCEDCDFAFCCVCRKGWHGVLSFCNPRRQAELNAEEAASLAYLQKYSTPCTTCNAPCQKTMGCNHMICFKCQTHFCYLCGSYLMPDNPYKHYNDLKSNCYMRLWELEAGDGQGAGVLEVWEPGPESEEEEDDAADPDGPADFAEFGGDEPLFLAEDSSDDEEPAPDVRRHERAIEIVNFAREGAANQRIVLPERPRIQGNPPPPVPAPPRRRPGNQARRNGQQPRQRNANQVQNRAANPPARPQNNPQPHNGHAPAPIAAVANLPQPAQPAEPDQAAQGQDFIQPRPAPGQDRFAAQQPAPVRAMGLDRFLELARQDLEDEWDSDELDEEDDFNHVGAGRGVGGGGGRFANDDDGEPLEAMIRRERAMRAVRRGEPRRV